MSKKIIPALLEYQMSPTVRAFSTQRTANGPADGPYADFNITHYCGDEADHVAASRRGLCQALGIADNRLFLPHQTHGTEVVEVSAELLELPAAEQQQQLYAKDCILTRERGVCIGVSTADCVPVLVYDASTQCVCAVHAGWRGVVGNAVGAAFRQLRQHADFDASQVRAVIGPSISQAAFEVGDEVVDAFAQAGFSIAQIARRMPAADGKRYHIDLWAAVSQQLLREGVSLDAIQVSGICTYAEVDTFFSARRLGIRSGRIFSGILLV